MSFPRDSFDIHNRQMNPRGILKTEEADIETVAATDVKFLACAPARLRVGVILLTPGTPETTHPQPLPEREGRNYLDGVMSEKWILERIQPKGGGLGAKPTAFFR